MLGSPIMRAALLGGAAPFSPASLFANNEQGVWFDPSDMSTMFQDIAGTTPVTAPRQTVGFMLDKSRGLVRGPELRGVGTPVSLGVPPAPATYNPATGQGTVSRTDAANQSTVLFTPGVVAGTYYQIDIENTSSPGVDISIRTDGINLVLRSFSSGPRQVCFLLPTTAELRVVPHTNGTTASFIVHSVRAIPGNHATQAIGSFRPAYQIDGTGRPFLLFDGVDDGMVTGTITPGTDKAQMIAGIRKLSDANRAILAEMSVDSSRLSIEAPQTLPVRYMAVSGGGIVVDARTNSTAFDAPNTAVLSNIADIAADLVALRVNSVTQNTTTLDQGVGGYPSTALFIGRRGGTSLPFNGNLYGLITRFGPNLSENLINAAEQWMNGKTGAY